MTVRKYVEQGRHLHKVSVVVRSKKDRSIRVQKTKVGIESLALAKKAEAALKQDAIREVSDKEHAELSWGKLVDQWELALRDGDGIDRILSSSTVRDYVDVLHSHTREWWRRPADEITRGDVRMLYQELADKGFSKSVAEKLRSAVNGIFAWAIDTHRVKGISQSPAFGVTTRRGREEEKRPEILTLTELKQLLEFARSSQHRWYPVWAMAALTGLRAGELCGLRWEDVDQENGLLHVRRTSNRVTGIDGPTKGRYWRDVPINADLGRLLQQLRASSAAPHVLPRIRELIKGEQARVTREFCEAAGLPSIRFHTLRACFATQLLGAGVSVPVVMRVGGWKSLKTMQRYIRLSGIEVKGATEALSLLPPEVLAQVIPMPDRGQSV